MTFSEKIMSLNPQDAYGRLRPLDTGDRLRCHFSDEQWRRMLWCDTDAEFYRWMADIPDFGAAFVYTSLTSDEALALAFVLVENKRKGIVTFHGGGWANPFVNYRCARLLISTLRSMGLEVRTRVERDNGRACRFVASLGFRRYRTAGRYRLFR